MEPSTHSHALNLGVAFLAAQSLHTEALLVVVLAVRRHVEQFALAGGTFNHVVVEMRNGDVVVLVGAFGNHLAQGVERIGHAAAEEAGVEVGVGAGDLDFPIGQAAQARGDARHVGGNHRGVGNEDDVGLHEVFVLLNPLREAARTDFLLAFEHELHVTGQSVGFHHRFKGFGVHERLAFVVVGATSPDFSVLDDRLKRVGVPQVDGIDGHHVVVAVNQHGRQFRVDGFLAIDDGIALGGHHLCLVGAGFQKMVAPALGTADHVGLVRRFRADGRDSDQVKQFLKETLLVGFDVVVGDLHNY